MKILNNMTRNSRFLLLIVLFIVLLSNGCATRPIHPALQDAALPELIPTREFFANPATAFRYKVSPDGRKLAWLAVKKRRLTVHFRSLASDAVQVIDTHSKRSVFNFEWAQDSRRIMYVQDQEGDENYHIFISGTENPQAKPNDLTPFANIRAAIHRIIKNDPDHILIVHNERDKSIFDLYRLNINTGELQMVGENPGDVLAWITDEDGRLRARIRQTAPSFRHHLEVWQQATSDWRTMADWEFDDTFNVWGFTPDDRGLWVTSNRARDRIGVWRFDLATGQESFVYEDPNVDVAEILVSRINKRLMAVLVNADFPKIHFFDEKVKQDAALFKDHHNFGLSLGSVDDQEAMATVTVYTDRSVENYLLDRVHRRKQLLNRHPLSRYKESLVEMKPISFKSRDGWTLHGYLLQPPGVTEKPLPMVLLVHGGPWARVGWGLDPLSQFLANRGYAVLYVNFRGSTGYGKSFMEAAVREFAGKMHTDLLDGVNWAVENNIADPNKICIFGGSYGGYAALVGMTFTPDIFACGVDIVGPSNLVSLLESVPEYWKLFMPHFYKYVGNPDNPEDRADMKKRSPLFYVDQVKSPLLIAQGGNDPRVKQQESEQMVAALRKAGKDVQYLLFPNDGHGIKHWKNRLQLFRSAEDFLAKHLGGRSNGFDYYELGALIF